MAHSALETGWWKHCHNWNLGNHKAGPYERHTFYECGEELPPERVSALQGDRELGQYVQVVAASKRPGLLSVKFLPPHPVCRFRAYTSLAEGVSRYLGFLATQSYRNAQAALLAADAAGFSVALAAAGYYTADVRQYTASLEAVYAEVLARCVGGLPAANSALEPRARLVDFCRRLLSPGTIGQHQRSITYRAFINCGMKPAGLFAGKELDDLSPIKTSCALFVRAVLHWCGRTAKVARVGVGIFDYLQVRGYGDPAWVPYRPTASPQPGDIFYVASTLAANDGHVGIFLAETEPGVWLTAEGGAGDGTACKLSERLLTPGKRFDARSLLGWFSAEKLGIPQAIQHGAPPIDPVPADKVAVEPLPIEPVVQPVSLEPADPGYSKPVVQDPGGEAVVPRSHLYAPVLAALAGLLALLLGLFARC